MIAIPTILVIITVNIYEVRNFMKQQTALYYSTSMVTLVMLFALFCFHGILRIAPLNYFYLIVFTISETYAIGTITCSHDPFCVLYGCIMAVVMSFSLTFYACITPSDLIGTLKTFLWSSIGVTLSAIIIILVIRTHFALIILYWTFGLLVLVYVIMNTEMIAEGKYKEISLDDYVIAAMMLFIDYISIFVYLLMFLSGRR